MWTVPRERTRLNEIDLTGCTKNLCRLQFSVTTCNEVNFIDMRMKLSQRNYYPCRWTAITAQQLQKRRLKNFKLSRDSNPGLLVNKQRSLDCALFCCKAHRKQLKRDKSVGRNTNRRSRVLLLTSACSSRSLGALQPNRAQSSRLLYLHHTK